MSMPLKRETYNETVDFLTQIDAANRVALLGRAFHGSPLLNMIVTTGASYVFAAHVLDACLRFGEIEDDVPAIEMLLREMRENFGLDKQQQIDALIEKIRADLGYPPKTSSGWSDDESGWGSSDWDETEEAADNFLGDTPAPPPAPPREDEVIFGDVPPEPEPAPQPEEPDEPQRRILEAAMPGETQQGVYTELKVKISLDGFPMLKDELPQVVETGDVIEKEDARATEFPLRFDEDDPKRGFKLGRVCLRVRSREFEVDRTDHEQGICADKQVMLTVKSNEPTPTVTFFLDPTSRQRLGNSAKVIIELYQDDELVASLSVSTRIVQQITAQQIQWLIAQQALGGNAPINIQNINVDGDNNTVIQGDNSGNTTTHQHGDNIHIGGNVTGENVNIGGNQTIYNNTPPTPKPATPPAPQSPPSGDGLIAGGMPKPSMTQTGGGNMDFERVVQEAKKQTQAEPPTSAPPAWLYGAVVPILVAVIAGIFGLYQGILANPADTNNQTQVAALYTDTPAAIQATANTPAASIATQAPTGTPAPADTGIGDLEQVSLLDGFANEHRQYIASNPDSFDSDNLIGSPLSHRNRENDYGGELVVFSRVSDVAFTVDDMMNAVQVRYGFDQYGFSIRQDELDQLYYGVLVFGKPND